MMSFSAATARIENQHVTSPEGKVYLKYSLRRPDAVAPELMDPGAAAYDITLVARTDERAEDATCDVNLFSTGLSVEPPEGYYCELVARSSLAEKGYMLANGVGIIDPSYRGEIKANLFKFKEAPDLELPCRAVQLLVKRKVNVYPAKTTPTGLSRTVRGAGGFGSTGGWGGGSARERPPGAGPLYAGLPLGSIRAAGGGGHPFQGGTGGRTQDTGSMF